MHSEQRKTLTLRADYDACCERVLIIIFHHCYFDAREIANCDWPLILTKLVLCRTWYKSDNNCFLYFLSAFVSWPKMQPCQPWLLSTKLLDDKNLVGVLKYEGQSGFLSDN